MIYCISVAPDRGAVSCPSDDSYRAVAPAGAFVGRQRITGNWPAMNGPGRGLSSVEGDGSFVARPR